MSSRDVARLDDGARVGAGLAAYDAVKWNAHMTLEKYHTPNGELPTPENLAERLEISGNLLVYGGASALWNRLISGTPTVTVFDNTNAHIGVGDSSTAEAAGQTDLQAVTNKLRKAMDATYPQHTDGTVVGSATVTFKSTFGTADANFTWAEWGVFNAATAGRMLNRKVQALGTKTSAGTWVITVTISIA